MKRTAYVELEVMRDSTSASVKEARETKELSSKNRS
jgi:hypothetical protein